MDNLELLLRIAGGQGEPKARPLLTMDGEQAREFFLKPESYCGFDLPPYVDFSRVLQAVDGVSGQVPLIGMRGCSPREFDAVNYRLLTNKDGRYAWRPFQLINPALYVEAVRIITEPDAWGIICARFREFQAASGIDCLSLPLESLDGQADRASQVSSWWQGVEQRSIELSLDYQYLLHADIASCYGGIYTHSIAWALHGREVAKAQQRDKGLVGNVLDWLIQDMQSGQTNGIPQGSVLMDFVAEMVLGYADLALSGRLACMGVSDYRILRYRDDYRVFVNSPEVGESILKCLTEVLIDLGLMLNSQKTTGARPVVAFSLKEDKWAWLLSGSREGGARAELLRIHAHGQRYPNSGSLAVAMTAFYREFAPEVDENAAALAAVALDIAFASPRVFPAAAAIVSALLPRLEESDRTLLLERVARRVRMLANVGHMEVWLQRVCFPLGAGIDFDERLCHLVNGEATGPLWECDWVSSGDLQSALRTDVIDRDRLAGISEVVGHDEVSLFSYGT